MVRSILFPTDFSAVANSAFPLALAIAAQFDAIVQSIHVAHGGDPHITETSRYEFPAHPTGSSSVRVIETIIPKDDDDPAQIIMRQAEQRGCDLIVMASHGRSDVAQFFLGRSVAEQVARDSKIPTVIARLYGPRRTTRPIDRFARTIYATDGGQGTLERFLTETGAGKKFDKISRLHGGVADAVVEHAGRKKADMVAITTALCSYGDAGLTDTSEFIIRNAPCPVLCVRP